MMFWQKSAWSRRILAIGFLAVLLTAGLLVGMKYRNAFAGVLQNKTNKRLVVAPEVGSLAPDFELSTLAGERLRMSDLHGKPILINFWATWCAPCILEMPNIQKYYEKYGDQFEVLAINARESEWDIRRFVEDIGISFPVLLDPEGKIETLYRIPGYPTTYIIDSEGIIRAQHIGQLSEKKMEEYLLSVGVNK